MALIGDLFYYWLSFYYAQHDFGSVLNLYSVHYYLNGDNKEGATSPVLHLGHRHRSRGLDTVSWLTLDFFSICDSVRLDFPNFRVAACTDYVKGT